MSYKSILVPIDGSPQSKRRIAVATRLAAAFQADLTGIAIVAPLDLPPRVSSPGAKALLTEAFDKSLGNAKSLAQAFAAEVGAAGVAKAHGRVVEAEPLQALEGAAQSADLLVLSQPGADDVGMFGEHFVERALTTVGRPVVLVPLKHEVQDIGRSILIGWKNAAGSARAVADARPLLEKAQSVTVLVVDEDGAGVSADEALEYLQRHGVQGKGMIVKSDDAGAAILSNAKKVGADLVVMGALARGRLAEMILGGATRTVLEKAGVCVLMSHSGS